MIAQSSLVRVVDDDASHRNAVSRVLQIAGYAVKPYPCAGEFLLDEGACDAPGCILLDLCMPGPSGLELHEALVRRGDAPPVIYVTGEGDVPSSVRAMKAGAVDFLMKPVPRNVLLDAVAAAVAVDEERRDERARRRELEARYASLTQREQDVMKYVVAGRLNKQIAADLGVAERTVKWHRAQMMEKMGATTLAQLLDDARALHQTL